MGVILFLTGASIPVVVWGASYLKDRKKFMEKEQEGFVGTLSKAGRNPSLGKYNSLNDIYEFEDKSLYRLYEILDYNKVITSDDGKLYYTSREELRSVSKTLKMQDSFKHELYLSKFDFVVNHLYGITSIIRDQHLRERLTGVPTIEESSRQLLCDLFETQHDKKSEKHQRLLRQLRDDSQLVDHCFDLHLDFYDGHFKNSWTRRFNHDGSVNSDFSYIHSKVRLYRQEDGSYKTMALNLDHQPVYDRVDLLSVIKHHDLPQNEREQIIKEIVPSTPLSDEELFEIGSAIEKARMYYKEQQDQERKERLYQGYASRNLTKERIKEMNGSVESLSKIQEDIAQKQERIKIEINRSQQLIEDAIAKSVQK